MFSKAEKSDTTAGHIYQNDAPDFFRKVEEEEFLGNQEQLPFFTPGIQAKLEINQPGNKYEQEADQVADRVMTMPDPAIQKKERKEEDEPVQMKQIARKEDEEDDKIQMKSREDDEDEPIQMKRREDDEDEPIQMKNSSEGANVISKETISSTKSFRSEGHPLPDSAKSFFNPRFGADFSQVRIHNDDNAAKSVSELHAKAYTTGLNVAFARNAYEPESDSGKRLLAHELTHVVQQMSGVKNYKGEIQQVNVKQGIKPFFNKSIGQGLESSDQVKPFFRGAGIVMKSPDIQNPTDQIRETEEQPIAHPVHINLELPCPNTFYLKATVYTYGDLISAFDDLRSNMFFARSYILPDEENNAYWTTWNNYMDNTIPFSISWYLKKNKEDHPFSEEIDQFRQTVLDIKELARKARSAFLIKDYEFKLRIFSERIKTQELIQSIHKTLRAEFLGKVDPDLNSNLLWTMADHLATFNGTLSQALGVPYTAAIAGKIVPGLVTIANVVVNWSTSSPAMLGSGMEGISALNNVISIAGAANSFLVNPGYLVTAYIGPMLSVISKHLAKLQLLLIQQNDVSAELFGTPLYHGSEPGGINMWNYMVNAMHASGPDEIPVPRGNIYDYLDTLKNRFYEFSKKKYDAENKNKTQNEESVSESPEKIPVQSSWIFWSKLDSKAFTSWLFANRNTVWILLYGSRNPQTAKPLDKVTK